MFEDWEAGLTNLKQGPPISAMELRRELDAATEKHIAALREVISLKPLEEALPREELANLDVLFQVEGELLGMPLDWLEVHGRPLWHGAVRSTSTVVSLTLRKVLERKAMKAGMPEKRLLAMFWDETDDRVNGYGVYRLQELLFDCQKQPWEVYGLGDDPKATEDTLVAALSKHKFGGVVANAHGSQRQAGIRLADGTQWCGQGNLEHTDLLILASCSVGRLSQYGVNDVEGMCAELAAHNGRCVIAARWPIEQNQTADFTTEIVRRYQLAVEQLGAKQAFVPAFTRARAFCDARRDLLTIPPLGESNTALSQHVAAAFSIYGWA
jgi:hypothetical protein